MTKVRLHYTGQRRGSSRFTSREGRKMVMMVVAGAVVTSHWLGVGSSTRVSEKAWSRTESQ